MYALKNLTSKFLKFLLEYFFDFFLSHQILHHPVQTGSVFTDHGGILDYYKGNYKSLLPYKNLTKDKFTYELSDHLPLWVQLNIDTADEEVDQLIAQRNR